MSTQKIACKIKMEQSIGSKNHTQTDNETSVKLVQQSILAPHLQPQIIWLMCDGCAGEGGIAALDAADMR
jgi:hypothetical protein